MKKRPIKMDEGSQYLSSQEMKNEVAYDDVSQKDWWGDLWNPDLIPQTKACEGKNTGDSCTFTYSGTTHTGQCADDYVRKTKICAAINGSGAATGTGALSAREAACLNKSKGDYCEFYDDNGSVSSGNCKINNNHIAARPLFCSQSIGVGSGADIIESE
ncbi:MAG: hypothetical protein OSJ33_03105 [Muribaculaceae bacterium]|jgi:hypothetical protein|nr:hypothetical protein [Muribaculaceae bacterium]